VVPRIRGWGREKRGSLDFYLADKKWDMELTRESDRLKSHWERFQLGGNYNRWIVDGELLDRIILDFRKTKPTFRHPGKQKLLDP
jgi:hypothetical protein